MSVAPIPVRHLEAIYALRDPAASLLASTTAYEALGQQFSADFCREMADDAAAWPTLYQHWAAEQAARVERIQREMK